MLLTVCILSVSFSAVLLFTAVQAASTLLSDISEHTKAAGVRKITEAFVLPMQTILLIRYVHLLFAMTMITDCDILSSVAALLTICQHTHWAGGPQLCT